MKDWLALFGKGQFTCGAKYVCFLPSGSEEYVNIAQAPPGTEDHPEWILFAEAIVEQLNEWRARAANTAPGTPVVNPPSNEATPAPFSPH